MNAIIWNWRKFKRWVKRTPPQFNPYLHGYREHQEWLAEVRHTVKPQPRPKRREP